MSDDIRAAKTCTRCCGHGYAAFIASTGGHGTCFECGGTGKAKPVSRADLEALVSAVVREAIEGGIAAGVSARELGIGPVQDSDILRASSHFAARILALLTPEKTNVSV